MANLSESWQEEDKKASQQGDFVNMASKANFFGKKIFWFIIIGLLIVIAISGYYFYQYFSSRDVLVAISLPGNVLVGQPFNLKVDFTNKSNNVLKNAEVSIKLPDGTAFTGEGTDKRITTKSLGDLQMNTTYDETVPVIVLNDPNTNKQFSIVLSYSPQAVGGAKFQRTDTANINVGGPVVNLDFFTPDKVLNGENFDTQVKYQNASDNDLQNIQIQLDYPQNFTFVSSSVPSSGNNNIWNIDTLKKGDNGSFIVTGSVIGDEGSFVSITSSATVSPQGQTYKVSEKTANINIAPSPLSLKVTVNGGTSLVASPGTETDYVITYKNNGDKALENAVITAQLKGEMFDFTSLNTKSFFSSLNNTLSWNAANTPELNVVQPGTQGTVAFTINLKQNYPIRRLSDKNYSLKINAQINSPTVPYYVASEKTMGMASLETKIRGSFSIAGMVDYSKGPLPVKVNSPTNFIVHWQITNSATDISNIEAQAYLQSGVRIIGSIKSNINSVPTYNDQTHQLDWKIDRIIANKGVVGQPSEAIFEVEAVPNVTQIGAPMPIVGDSTITAHDDFINADFRNSSPGFGTNSLSGAGQDQQRVIQ